MKQTPLLAGQFTAAGLHRHNKPATSEAVHWRTMSTVLLGGD